MSTLRHSCAIALIALGLSTPSSRGLAEPGKVEIPLADYQKLLESAANGTARSTSFALGDAQVQATIEPDESGAIIRVRAALRVQVLADGWVMVPLLPAGTAVTSSTVDGNAVELVAGSGGIAWATRDGGSHSIVLEYQVDAIRSSSGYSATVPAPPTASTRLTATIPARDIKVAVMPAAGVRSSTVGASTVVSAVVPATSGIQLTWQGDEQGGHALSRALYSGVLRGDAIEWTATFTAELFDNEASTVKLLPSSVALKDVTVDGKSASILRRGDSFATLVKGRGHHTIVGVFLVPVQRADGPPSASLAIRKVPVSRFELTLPGKKTVSTAPSAEVEARFDRNRTSARVFLPMTTEVTFTWSEAIPDAADVELRANASVYHSALAREGVLHSQAIIDYQVTAGETHAVEIEIPADIQINRVIGATRGVSDWRVTSPGVLTVFFDRKLGGELRFTVEYERLLTRDLETFEIPLLIVKNTHRQRGMIALLAGRELTMEPTKEDASASRVGENQLPKHVRETLEETIAHTFKYIGKAPTLVVKTAAPQRVAGRFDAQVDTLISLGDATMKGVARVEVDVKSGGITELDLDLPADVNFLNLTAPSLRGSKVITSKDGAAVVHVEFTQDMEGQFTVEVSYERIMKEGDTALEVPTIKVRGAEVEQGRIAVEALAAMEVVASVTDQLSAVQVSQLPQQLVLQTTNPILMAYRYAYAEPAHRLALTLTRHRAITTQAAVIDSAHYQSLVTREGLMITRATFAVRNTSEQFLKLRLPRGSEVWKAFVDGREEKPALVKESHGDGPEVLIKIVNSVDPFGVELVFKTPTRPLGAFGTISASLPRPEMITTKTVWDVYLPDGQTYRKLASNLDLVAAGVPVAMKELEGYTGEAGADKSLRISVPAVGIHYRFEKVYANQSRQVSGFSISYLSPTTLVVEQILAALGMLLLLIGAAVLWTNRHRVIWIGRRRLVRAGAMAGVIVGAVLLVTTVGLWGTSAEPPFAVAVLVAIAATVRLGWLNRAALKRLPTMIKRRTPAPAGVPTNLAVDAAPSAPVAAPSLPDTTDTTPGGDE